jgi:hypothetical protein
MKERVQGCVTVGVAMVGAGALALAPMAPQPAVQMRAVDIAKVNLLAETLPTTLPAKLAELATGLAGSGENFVVDTALGALIPLAVAQALNSANPEAALKAIAGNVIDAPLQIADPTIFALDNILPVPFGGDTSDTPQYSQGSDILKFRVQVLYALREEIKQALGLPSALDASSTELMSEALITNDVAPSPVGNPVLTATRLAQGLGESGERLLTDTALGLLGPVAAAQALAKGDNEGLYKVVESYVDAPLHIADPTIFAIDDVLPKPFGGDPSTNPKAMNGSIVSNIRADVLIPARDAIKPGLKNVLGVPTTANKVGTVQQKPAAQLASDTGTATKKPTSHRKPTNNPVSSALKKLAKDVKKATAAPKHAKPSAE